MVLVLVSVLSAALAALVWGGAVIIKKRIKLNRKLNRLMDSKEQYEFLILDVRTSQSYETGHIPGALSFPLEEMDYLPVEDMFLTIVVYGRNRKDTRRAAGFLSCNGYFNVIPFGSVRRWKGSLEEGQGRHISQIPPTKEPQNGATIGSPVL